MRQFALNVLAAGFAEARVLTRLFRFRLLVILVSGFLVSCFVVGGIYGGFMATVSPSFGFNTPYFLLSWIDPTFFFVFQFALLWLGFDSAHRDVSNRIHEVLDSMPISNFEYIAGQTVGLAGLVWIVIGCNLIAMQMFAMVFQALDPSLFEPFHLQSLCTLLFLDAPVTLMFWAAVVNACSVLIKSRVLVLLFVLVPMVGWSVITVNAPYWYASILSPITSDAFFLSEIVMERPAWTTVMTRIASVIATLSILAFGARFVKRSEISSKRSTRLLAPVVASLAGTVYLGVIWWTTNHSSLLDDWARAVEQTSVNEVDVTQMSGTVRIDPGERLELDLNITFRTKNLDTDQVFFLFNPGMKIREFSVEDFDTQMEFHNGVLVLKGSGFFLPDQSYVVNLVADGIPDGRFAYLDSAVDYLIDREVPKRTAKLLGRDASIFRNEYVALMPGSYWYPVPLTETRDFLNIELDVDISRRNWQLASAGSSLIESDEDGTKFNVTPSCAVSEIGLFASKFEKATIILQGMPFSIFLHEKHAHTRADFTKLEDVVRSSANDILREFTDFGLEIPCNELSLVEVPNQLRTVGGGWRMENLCALPGVVLLKEYGLPRVRMKKDFELFVQQNLLEKLHLPGQIELLYRYLNAGIGTDNPWMTIPELIWSHATSATGENSAILQQIPLALLSSGSRTSFEFFSIYSTLHVAERTKIDLRQAQIGLWRVSQIGSQDERFFGVWNLEEEYLERASAWNTLESVDNNSTYQNLSKKEHLETLLLKSNEIARGLLAVNGRTKIFQWLADLQQQFKGSTYTHEDLLKVARARDVVVEPFLTDWIESFELPGYLSSPATVTQATVNEDEVRYQIAVSVHNAEPTRGFVQVRYDNWYPATGYTQSHPVPIDGHSSTRIRLIASRSMRDIEIVPVGLSYNRYPFAVSLEGLFESAPPVAQLAPSSEADDWRPLQSSVIVDDLDTGFIILQPKEKFRLLSRFGPISWIFTPRLEGDLDHGLLKLKRPTDTRMFPDVWGRVEEAEAFGTYRHTFATVEFRRDFPRIRFSAEIPEQGEWQLDYHVAIPWRGGWRKDLRYLFEIHDNENTYDGELAVEKWHHGWNSIGEFDVQAGVVNVDLIGTTKRGPGDLWADAIRWTRADVTD